MRDACFPDRAGYGFDSRAHRVQKCCQLACAFSFSALFKQKSGQSHNISVEGTPVWHDYRLLKKNLAVVSIKCVIHAKLSLAKQNIGRRKCWWKGEYGELNQWEPQRCDWLTDACKFQNNVALWRRGCGWKTPHAWSLLCHHDHELAQRELRLRGYSACGNVWVFLVFSLVFSVSS